MSRRGRKNGQIRSRNRLVNMLVNRILKHGKKSLAYQILYRTIQQKTEKNPLSVLRQAIRGVTPSKSKTCRRIDPESSYFHRIYTRKSTCGGGFQMEFRIRRCGVAMPYAKRKRLIEWQRQIELLHIFVNP